MKIALKKLALPLRAPLQTAHGSVSVRHIIEVSATEHGHTGHSEASPLPGFGLETYEEALAQLERWAERTGLNDDRDTSHDGGRDSALPQTPCARAAAEGALANLDAALEAVTLTELLTGDDPHARPTDAAKSHGTIPPDTILHGTIPPENRRLAVQALVSHPDPETAAQQAVAAANAGHLAIKLKVAARTGTSTGKVDAHTNTAHTGTDTNTTSTAHTNTTSINTADIDIHRIIEVRRALPAAVALRLDANGGWDQATAGRILRRVSRLDIDFVETPTPQPADWAQLARRTGTRFAADEHLSGAGAEAALDQLIEAGAIEVAILKPATVGGPQAAYDLACRASVSGISSVVSSFMCSTAGLRIARDVALAVDPNIVHGVGTGALFTEPLAPDVTPIDGYLHWKTRLS